MWLIWYKKKYVVLYSEVKQSRKQNKKRYVKIKELFLIEGIV